MAEAADKAKAKKIKMNAVYLQAPGPSGTRGVGMNMSAVPACKDEPARVAYGSGRQVWVRQVEDISKSFYYKGHIGNVTGVRWHPRYHKGADWICSTDDEGGWRVWTVRADEPITQGTADVEGFTTGKELYDCCWEPSGKKILVVGKGKEEKGRLGDWKSGVQFGHSNEGGNKTHLTCDATTDKPYRFLVSGESGVVYLYNVQGGMLTNVGNSGKLSGGKYVNIVRLHPSGNFAACGTGDGKCIYFVNAWDCSKLLKWDWRKNGPSIFGMSWSESGSKLAVCGADRKITIFSVNMPHELKEGNCEFDLDNFKMEVIGEYECGPDYLYHQTCCTFVGEDRVISQSTHGDLVIVNGECEFVNSCSGHYSGVIAIESDAKGRVYSASGHKIIVADPENNTIRGYKGNHGEGNTRGRPASWETMALSADGDTIIAVAGNNTLSRTPVDATHISEPIKLGGFVKWLVAGKKNNDLIVMLTREGLCSYMGLKQVSMLRYDCDNSPCADLYPDDSMLVMTECIQGEKNHVRYYSVSETGELKFVEDKKMHGRMKGEIHRIRLNPTNPEEAIVIFGRPKSMYCTNLANKKCLTSTPITPFNGPNDAHWRPGATSSIGVTGHASNFGVVRKNETSTPWLVTRDQQDLPHYNNIGCFTWINADSVATADDEGAVHIWQFKKKKGPGALFV